MDRSRFRHAGKINQSANDWVDWLNDEPPSPVARQELRQKRVERANQYRPRPVLAASAAPAAAVPNPAVKTIEINLRWPKPKDFSRIRKSAGAIKHSRHSVAKFGIVAVLATLLLIGLIFRGPAQPAAQNQPAAKAKTTPIAAASQIKQLPQTAVPLASPSPSPSTSVLSAKTTNSASANNLSFKPVVPLSEPQLAQSQFGRTSYDANRGVYTYVDSYNGTPLTVNEEAVPSGQSAQSTLTQNASQAGASQPLSFSGGTAYLQPSGSGAQSLVLCLRGILVFINSPKSLSDSDWQTYINNLT